MSIDVYIQVETWTVWDRWMQIGTDRHGQSQTDGQPWTDGHRNRQMDADTDRLRKMDADIDSRRQIDMDSPGHR